MLLRALLVAFVAVCVVGCSGGASCYQVVTFSPSPDGFGKVNVSGYEAFDCTVTLSSQGRSAVTTMKARSAPTTAPPPIAPTMTDEVACRSFDSSDAQFCTQTTGPAYTSCARSTTCLYVMFQGEPGTGIDAYLGVPGAYEVRVECGGVVVASSSYMSRPTQQCAV